MPEATYWTSHYVADSLLRSDRQSLLSRCAAWCIATGMGLAEGRARCGCKRRTSHKPSTTFPHPLEPVIPLRILCITVMAHWLLNVDEKCRVVCASDHDFLAEWSRMPNSCHEDTARISPRSSRRRAHRRPPPHVIARSRPSGFVQRQPEERISLDDQARCCPTQVPVVAVAASPPGVQKSIRPLPFSS